ncbi:peptidoglycan-binding protein [Streptomyces sp. 4.24]|uniref:peptidoglycan-binding protein n=1 Tax=Streptomyces tritrimontium TaxID=3406573 RepID=UPI003BB80D0D
MTSFHAAIVHPDQTVTYCGEVDTAHVETARAIAQLDTTPRFTREHARRPGSLFVLRADGDLDWYEPLDAEPFTVRTPDPAAREVPAEDLPAPQDLPRGGGGGGTVWIPGAIRIGDGSIGGAMDTPGNPPRVTLHTTESPAGGRYLESLSSYLIQVGSEPQLVYCPVTDRVAQLGPLTQSGRALRNDGARRTNREGKVNIQIEVLAYAKNPWTNGFNPEAKPGWRSILAAARSHGVPDAFPAGPPGRYPGPGKPRSRSVWQNSGGYFGHCDIPGNDHGDPGALDTAKVLGRSTGGGGGTQPPADGNAFPGTGQFGPGANNAYVTRLGTLLCDRGGRRFYSVGPSPEWGEADRRATEAFQRAQGWSGSDADGIPGPTTWELLVTGRGNDIPGAEAPRPTLSVAHLAAAARKDIPAPDGHTTYPGEVRALEDALVAEGLLNRSYADGSFGTKTRDAYAAWQRSKAGGSYTGSAADGIPGLSSLQRLAARHAFNATA